MDTLTRPIIGLYQLSQGLLATAAKDLSPPEAVARSRAGQGPSVAWTIGHLCHFKIVVLGLLGHTRDNPYAAQFEKTAASDGAGYASLADLLAQFAALNTDLCAALTSAAARLDSPMPGSGAHGEKKILETVLFFAWHEAYHIGAISALRKELGRKGLAELVQGR
jgi:uncharacterized damage-inducible protein DinB